MFLSQWVFLQVLGLKLQVQTPSRQLHTEAALAPGSSATALQDWHGDTKKLQWESWDQLHETQGCSQHR